jgi:hypothetical protein
MQPYTRYTRRRTGTGSLLDAACIILASHPFRQTRHRPFGPSPRPAQPRGAHGRRAGGDERSWVGAGRPVWDLRGRSDVRAFQRDPSRRAPRHSSWLAATRAERGRWTTPWGPTDEESRAFVDQMQAEWGSPFGLDARAPSMAGDKRFGRWWGRLLRMSASPAAAAALTTMNAEIDIRDILPTIRVPTLILHSVHDHAIALSEADTWRSDFRGETS